MKTLRDKVGTAGVGVAIWAIVYLGLLGAATGCKGDSEESREAERGEVVEVEVDGIRSVIERHMVAGDDGYMVMGRSGADLHARVILVAPSGEVLSDQHIETIVLPVASAGCLSGTTGYAALLTESEGERQLYMVRVEPGQAVAGGDAPVTHASGRFEVSAVSGDTAGCGLCTFDGVEEELRCQFDMTVPNAHVWETGALGHWEVMRAGESWLVADWSANDEGWVLVRIGALDPEETQVEWIHGYEVAQLPSLAEAEDRGQAEPRFVPSGDQVHVFFVDGTEYFTRIFAQIFPIDGDNPEIAAQLEYCRGTCDLKWAGRIDGVTWVWYRDESRDYVERINNDGSRSRLSFEAPDDVEPLGDGLFKLSLGNTIGNLWAVVAAETD